MNTEEPVVLLNGWAQMEYTDDKFDTIVADATRIYEEREFTDVEHTDRSTAAFMVDGKGKHKKTVSVAVDVDGRSSCTCPLGSRGIFCKHVLALLMVRGQEFREQYNTTE